MVKGFLWLLKIERDYFKVVKILKEENKLRLYHIIVSENRIDIMKQ